MSSDAQATFCATLVDSWIALGLRHAVVAPGSRSTPMALALAARPDLAVHVAHDERSAAFIALGIGRVTRAPAAVLCTSGTAGTHFHAAVVEAGLSNVPLLVLTADRPPELHDVGAPQTIEQAHLFGRAVRWFHDPGVATSTTEGSWRSLAGRSWAATLGRDPGPVHLNLPFRDPLAGSAGALPGAAPTPWSGGGSSAFGDLDELLAMIAARRGVIVAGAGVDDPAAVGRLADVLGWPVLADARSGCRALAAAVGAFDAILRSDRFADAFRPEVVVRLGERPASKVLGQWLVACGSVQVQVDDSSRVFDADHVVAAPVSAPIGTLCDRLADELAGPSTRPPSSEWRDAWRVASAAADGALDGEPEHLDEPTVARVLTSGALNPGTQLVVASSMPIRDVEWFGGTAADLVVHANRGANGIDGVVATGIGVAIGSGAPTVVLLGDIALCHDASSLTALAGRRLDLTIIVIDNDGGGIFSFLPQAEQLPAERFEELFGTPHGTDVVALANAHGIAATTVCTPNELRTAMRMPGTTLVRIASDRTTNVVVHARLVDAVTAAVDATLTDRPSGHGPA